MKQVHRTFLQKVASRLRKLYWKYITMAKEVHLSAYRASRPTAMVRSNGNCWRYSTPNKETWIRAKQMLTKEPQTIDWLNTLEDGQTFWDIGANVGTFSLYAASIRNATVLSFEPIYNTYALLVENILVNRLAARVSPYCLAFSDHTGIGTWHVEHWEAGSSDHQIDLSTNIGEFPHQYHTTLNILCNTIDDFIENCSLKVPSHIKIDVDGGESNILRGAERTLCSKSLHSILVEINEEDTSSTKEIVDILGDAGFQLKTKNPLKYGPMNPYFNYVFWRQ